MLLRRFSVLAALLMLATKSAVAQTVPDPLSGQTMMPRNISTTIPQQKLSSPAVNSNTRLILSLSDRRVYVYRDNYLQASYPVAIGQPGWETPTGTFQVMDMVSNPSWESPFTGEIYPAGVSGNPLGPRWIAFATKGNNYIGFHGTPYRDSIGYAASYGCARMRNEDIVDLYQQVELGTVITVLP